MLEYNKDLALVELLKYPIEEIMLYEWYYDIPGYEGFYQCNNFGKVYGVKRRYLLRGHYNNRENRMRYTLYKDGKCKEFNAARLVLLTFYGFPINNKLCSCHKDGNSINDRLDNLYWGSFEDNEVDKKRHGRSLIGENHHQAFLTEKDIMEIRRLRNEENIPFYKIGKMFKVSKTNIMDICKYKTWKHI